MENTQKMIQRYAWEETIGENHCTPDPSNDSNPIT